jgi:gas vesicle protein
MVGLLAGAATGVLFTPVNGKKFRDKLSKEIKKGGYGKESLYKHFQSIAHEIKDTASESLKGTELEKTVKQKVKQAKTKAKTAKKEVKSKVKQAKSAAKKSIKIAKDASKEIKKEIKGSMTDEK